jgi:hypothetical protein
MSVDPFRLTIAIVPLAAYMLVLGLINLRRRPFLTSGGADLSALGVALSGLAFIGPLELFRPEALTGELGNYIWLFLLLCYCLCLVSIVLLARPRLVIYNISPEELHPVLADAAARLDLAARWAGSHLALPTLGVQLHLDSFDIMRNVSLVSSGGRQDIDGWRRLARELSRSLRTIRVKSNPRALGLIVVSLILLATSVMHMVNNPVELAESVGQVFAY